jgi:outer membrane protein TolC
MTINNISVKMWRPTGARGGKMRNLFGTAGKGCLLLTLLILLVLSHGRTQTLTLRDVIDTALNNYGTIKAKASYLKASQASRRETMLDYFPNLTAGAQQAYGTANGQFGPVFASGGLNSASSGPPLSVQNWHAAFGG